MEKRIQTLSPATLKLSLYDAKKQIDDNDNNEEEGSRKKLVTASEEDKGDLVVKYISAIKRVGIEKVFSALSEGVCQSIADACDVKSNKKLIVNLAQQIDLIPKLDANLIQRICKELGDETGDNDEGFLRDKIMKEGLEQFLNKLSIVTLRKHCEDFKVKMNTNKEGLINKVHSLLSGGQEKISEEKGILEGLKERVILNELVKAYRLDDLVTFREICENMWPTIKQQDKAFEYKHPNATKALMFRFAEICGKDANEETLLLKALTGVVRYHENAVLIIGELNAGGYALDSMKTHLDNVSLQKAGLGYLKELGFTLCGCGYNYARYRSHVVRQVMETLKHHVNNRSIFIKGLKCFEMIIYDKLHGYRRKGGFKGQWKEAISFVLDTTSNFKNDQEVVQQSIIALYHITSFHGEQMTEFGKKGGISLLIAELRKVLQIINSKDDKQEKYVNALKADKMIDFLLDENMQYFDHIICFIYCITPRGREKCPKAELVFGIDDALQLLDSAFPACIDAIETCYKLLEVFSSLCNNAETANSIKTSGTLQKIIHCFLRYRCNPSLKATCLTLFRKTSGVDLYGKKKEDIPKKLVFSLKDLCIMTVFKNQSEYTKEDYERLPPRVHYDLKWTIKVLSARGAIDLTDGEWGTNDEALATDEEDNCPSDVDLSDAYFNSDDDDSDDEKATIKYLTKEIKLVRHQAPLQPYKNNKRLINQFEKSPSLSWIVGSESSWKQFSMTTLALRENYYCVILGRLEDAVGAIWTYEKDEKITEAEWFGEISNGWFGGTRENVDSAKSPIVSAIEKWFQDNDNQW